MMSSGTVRWTLAAAAVALLQSLASAGQELGDLGEFCKWQKVEIALAGHQRHGPAESVCAPGGCRLPQPEIRPQLQGPRLL